MKNGLPKGILSASVLAARVLCQGQVYSQNIPSFAERHGLVSLSVHEFLPAPHQADEVRITSYTHGVGSAESCTEWYISTNALARQPRWDEHSKEPPLSVGKACALALKHIRHQFPVIKSWVVESVRLGTVFAGQGIRHSDVWFYQIDFRPRDAKEAELFGNDPATCPMQVVLLDGTVVPPRVCKSK